MPFTFFQEFEPIDRPTLSPNLFSLLWLTQKYVGGPWWVSKSLELSKCSAVESAVESAVKKQM